MFNYSPFHRIKPKQQENRIMALPIKQHRKKLGLTQKALAAKLGVSLPSVVNWENGKIAPRGKNLAKIEKFLASKTSGTKKTTKKAVSKPKKKRGRPKGKVGRPKKTLKQAAAKKRGRPKGSTSTKKRGLSTQLSGVAKDLGFANVDDLVKTILRKHKIGKLDI